MYFFALHDVYEGTGKSTGHVTTAVVRGKETIRPMVQKVLCVK